MEMKGMIRHCLGTREGTGERGRWMAASYVLETIEMYPRRMAFDVFGEERIERLGLREGMVVTVYFDIAAHEHEGRWYNTIRAYDARPVMPAQ